MQKSEKIPFVDTAIRLLRRLLVLSVIVSVAALAIFWESLPASIKKTVTSLSADHSDKEDNTLIPHKFRIENNSEIPENISVLLPHHTQIAKLPNKADCQQSEILEYRNKNPNQTGLDEATLARFNDELKQLGVTVCQLTYWGDKRNMFRFSCQVPIQEHNPIAVRTFQSIAPDAIQSMQEVIDQVKQWQSTHR